MKEGVLVNQQLYDFKEKLLNTGIFKHQSGDEYTCQCPSCNDNKKHCYVIIRLRDDKPVLFHCFKCNSSGIVNKKFLDYFGIGDDLEIPRYSTSKKLDINSSATIKQLGVTVDSQDNINGISEYINSRVGHIPTLAELQMFQYIGKPYKYARDYLGCDDKKTIMHRNWFKLTNGCIIGRWYNDDVKLRWLRLKSNKVRGVGLYTMKLPVDTYQPINVYIAEGIMDAIGLYYNHPGENCFYIATLGKDYNKGIKHLINMGIFGKSVSVKIFKDPDVDVSSINIKWTTKKLFKRIDVYENLLGFDYGVKPDKLEVGKCVEFNRRFIK